MSEQPSQTPNAFYILLEVGNTERLKLFFRKLKEGKCIHAIVFGASVSRGTNVGGLKGAWHTKLKSWMDKNYPCNEEEGHTFVMTGLGGGSTKTVVDNYERVLTLRDKIDIFFVEVTFTCHIEVVLFLVWSK